MVIKIKELCQTEQGEGKRTVTYMAVGLDFFGSVRDYIYSFNPANVLSCEDEFDGECTNLLRYLSFEVVE